jgi:hypothetical protein
MLIINGMRRKQVSPLPALWKQRLQLLAAKTGMKRTITFLQSQKVRIPTVIGILKPVVLVPAMIISGLPADQLEIIIVHELAHIRRYDFLINILQSIMEALFFYHPVVWIISENIRQEREKCCDDYTVKVCGQVSLYARALTCLSELQITAAIPSVAITGNKKNIVHRVERLINSKKMKTNRSERLIAGLVLMTSVLIITLSTGATFKPAGFAQMESQIVTPHMDKKVADTVTDPEPVAEPAAVSPVSPPAAAAEPAEVLLPASISLPAPASPPAPVALPDTSSQCDHVSMDVKDNLVTREFHNKDGEDHEMKFVIRQGTVEELYVDGKKIPKNEFPKYQKEIDVTLEDLKDMERDLKHARIELENIDFDKIKEDIRIDLERFKEEDMKKLHEDMKKLQEEQLAIQLDKEAMQEQIKRAMQDMKIDREKLHEDMMRAMEEFQDGAYKLNEEEFRKAMEQMEQNMAEARENMAMIDEEQIQKMMDEAVKSIQDIDHDKIQREIQEAIKKMEEIDFAKIAYEMQAAMQNMEKDKINLEKEKKNMDKMIEELEKLELDKK